MRNLLRKVWKISIFTSWAIYLSKGGFVNSVSVQGMAVKGASLWVKWVVPLSLNTDILKNFRVYSYFIVYNVQLLNSAMRAIVFELTLLA